MKSEMNDGFLCPGSGDKQGCGAEVEILEKEDVKTSQAGRYRCNKCGRETIFKTLIQDRDILTGDQFLAKLKEELNADS